MHKITLKKIDESYYTHQLKNGLRIVFVQKKDFQTSSFYLGFPYGSLDANQVDTTGNIFQDPLGIAHFLEHKLFENNNGLDIMSVFSALGSNVNAFTSHNETVYLFNSNVNIKRSLDHLLDFVFTLNITEESVEKEKGIIEQELRMYAQMPEQRLVLETFKSLYHVHPIINDIGGTIESVHSITKKALETIYHRNYHPSNAVLICISPIQPKKLLKMIDEKTQIKKYESFHQLKRHLALEDHKVARKYHEFTMDIQASKMTYSFKLMNLSLDPIENLRNEWILRIYLELVFSPLNPKYQTWIEKGLIHDYFGYEVEINSEYGFVLFFGESENVESFKTLIDDTLSSFDSSLLTHFTGVINRSKSAMIRTLNNHDDYALSMMRSIFNKFPFEEQFNVLDQISVEDLKNVHLWFANSDHAIVFMKNNREN